MHLWNLALATPAVLTLLSSTQGKPLSSRKEEASVGNAIYDTPATYEPCKGTYNLCANGKAQALVKPAVNQTRKLAYFPIWESTQGSEVFDDSYLSGLTHLILFGVDARDFNATAGGLRWVDSPAKFPIDSIAKARANGTAVMAAIGGWDIDTLFKNMTTVDQAQKMGTHIAKFAVANNLDGVDIDHEYPSPEQKELWPAMIKQIRKDAPSLILSAAVPGIPHAKVENELLNPMRGWTQMISDVKDNVDFFNVMSYDLVNGYSNGTKAYHHASLPGTIDTVKEFKKLGVEASKLNTGFAFYARYFPMSTCASNADRLKCDLDAKFPDGSASSMRFNKLRNTPPCPPDMTDQSILGPADTKACGEPKSAERTQKLAVMASWKATGAVFNEKVLARQGTLDQSVPDTYDSLAKADSFWDEKNHVFWTWQSPFGIKETCEAMKKENVGGQFAFAIGQDSQDLVHMKAWQDCVNGK